MVRRELGKRGRVPWSGGNEGVVVNLSDVLGAGRSVVTSSAVALFTSFGLVDQILVQWATGKLAKAVRSSRASASMAATAGNLGQHGGDLAQLLDDLTGGRLGEDRAAGGGHHLGGASWHAGEDVSEELDPAALPAGTGHDRGDGPLEPGVGVGADQLPPGEPSCLKRAQERRPKAPSSESPTSRPSTSRPPSAVTPVAITTAGDTTRRATGALR